MANFDKYIVITREYLEKISSDTKLKSSCKVSEINTKGIKTGIGAGKGLVLKADTFLELGGPVAGSCAFTMQTSNMSLVNDDSILVIGSDIKRASKPMPFGQIITVAGENLSDKDYIEVIKYQRISNYIEGYMVKSIGNNIWTRISKDLGTKDFNFFYLGAALISLIKDNMPKIIKAEVVFITSSREDVLNLEPIVNAVNSKYQNIKEKKWADRGVNIYDCAFHGNCSSCSDKNVCDEINKIAKVRNA